jgi:hypothetical protein
MPGSFLLTAITLGIAWQSRYDGLRSSRARLTENESIAARLRTKGSYVIIGLLKFRRLPGLLLAPSGKFAAYLG